MFTKILIANRGEIACRIIRTARRLGVATVAVYSEADAGALHVEMADEAWPIGPAPARASYLNLGAIVEAARASGAQAVHPGYGFLAENAEFAEACAAAGIVFIGPPPEAIRAMGSKAAAKALMRQHGVPLVPGYHGQDQDDARLLAEAEAIGFPVLLKASAGGGGKGMRVVERADGFAAALAGARREASAAFGDDRILIEKYLTRPRHIEIQIFADRHGNAVHLFERDCSLQRRHQKIVEEAPAPGIDAEERHDMAEAALAAARAVGYVGAGTAEFIAEEESFYFIEMNTRLQVEHPVTEAVTGLDLVEWQLRIAAGEPLPLAQHEITLSGHAIEVRLYAENPARHFLPQSGTLRRLRLPPPELARVEAGVREGDAVTAYYDPMLAKIIVSGGDRTAALAQLRRALGEMAVLGVTTNLDLLARLVAHPSFVAGDVDTGFVERHRADLVPPAGPAPEPVLAAATVSRLLAREKAVRASDSEDRFSPWIRRDGWRLGARAAQTIVFADRDEERRVEAVAEGGGWRLGFGEHTLLASGIAEPDGALALSLDGVRRRLVVLDHAAVLIVVAEGERWSLREIDPLAPRQDRTAAAGRLVAPMPGRIARILVAPGARVRRGAALAVVEAMKMEHTVVAPADGVVEAVRFAVGDLVEEGAELIVLAATARRSPNSG